MLRETIKLKTLCNCSGFLSAFICCILLTAVSYRQLLGTHSHSCRGFGFFSTANYAESIVQLQVAKWILLVTLESSGSPFVGLLDASQQKNLASVEAGRRLVGPFAVCAESLVPSQCHVHCQATFEQTMLLCSLPAKQPLPCFQLLQYVQ